MARSQDSRYFYRDLPAHEDFCQLVEDLDRFVSVPPDWYLVIADIVNSTGAIALGRYKEVNLTAASIIVALLNECEKDQIPFSFGGDGCAILIPPHLRETAESTITIVQDYARRALKLELRGRVIPVSAITAIGNTIRVAKFRASSTYHQALFTGGGLAHAERLIRSNENDKTPDRTGGDANFTGLVCPWRQIHRNGRYIILLVQAQGTNLAECHRNYARVIRQLRTIFEALELPNPVRAKDLEFTLRHDDLRAVVGFRSLTTSSFPIVMKMQVSRALLLVAKFFTKIGLKVGGLDFGRARSIVTADIDYRKFDDLLRVILFVDDSHTLRQIEKFLGREQAAGRLVYGVSVDTGAHLTCIIKRGPWHMGLLDGADGGYTQASRAVKQVSQVQK
ncbi:MAG: DUF3095 domain-containing protein [Proteobacteria bacterium]|nr:DUF3095 domain-containing protein [Pseudomonadota bacterium]